MKAPKLKNKQDTLSYVLGADIGKSLRMSKIELNENIFIKGLQNSYKQDDQVFTKEEVEKVLQNFQQEMKAKMNEEKNSKTSATKAKGDSFQLANRKQPGVVKLDDGLQYRVITPGTGDSPVVTDTVTVYYKGMLIDGTVFDATNPGEPVSFPLGNLIKGWTEGIQLMKEGSKYEFVIPPDLGYGDREVGPIPAGSTLVFEVELISIKPGPPSKTE